jgi:hypothetical protein
MQRYLDEGVVEPIPDSAVFVRREPLDGPARRGLVVALDLEHYDYSPQSTAQIRASEETIPERLPARVDVRRNAALETPHVMVLFHDPDDTVMNAVEAEIGTTDPLYATSLMKGGGSLTGFQIEAGSPAAETAVERLAALDAVDRFGFRFAAGDGNHSLAAAKELWEERKSNGAEETDPLRWCLVELVNVYDAGLPFRPIHRLVAGSEADILDALLTRTDARFHGFPVDRIAGHIMWNGLAANEIAFIGPRQAGVLTLPEDHPLPVEPADAALADAGCEHVDYVHGFEEVVTAAGEQEATAIVLPEIDRSGLFETVRRRGALPRKAFSLGEAQDKRYYMECRALTR